MSLDKSNTTIGSTLDGARNGSSAVADPPAGDAVAAAPPVVETRGERLGRKARRTRFHLVAVSAVLLLVYLVALVVANTRQVELNWVFGSSTASLVWIVLFSAILGWLLGILSSAVFHWRTRAPRA